MQINDAINGQALATKHKGFSWSARNTSENYKPCHGHIRWSRKKIPMPSYDTIGQQHVSTITTSDISDSQLAEPQLILVVGDV
jgi:hypothetical protein